MLFIDIAAKCSFCGIRKGLFHKAVESGCCRKAKTVITQQFGQEGIGWEYVEEGSSISGGEARWKVIDPPAYREDGTGGDYTSLGKIFGIQTPACWEIPVSSGWAAMRKIPL